MTEESPDRRPYALYRRFHQMRLDRRRVLRGMAGAGLMAPLSSLTAASQVVAAPETGGARPSALVTSAAQGDSRATTLVMAAAEVASNIDVEYSLQNSAHYVWDQVFERLLEFAPLDRGDGFFELDFSKLEPRLAESWEYSSDGTSITWRLRQGVKSHAGNELTADDVKYTWDRKFALKGIGGFFTSILNLDGPDSVKVIDRYTVQFTSRTPTSIFESIQPQGYQGILDSVEFKKHATSDDPWSTKWFANNASGFGPYRLESLSPSREVTFSRHEDYYRDKPQMTRLLYRQVPASSQRVALLTSGDVDIVPDLLPRELEDLRKGRPGAQVVDWEGNQMTSVVMNVSKPPFDRVEVRQAMNYATPYNDIQQAVYFGHAQQMKSPYARIYPHATQEFWNYETDLDKAKQLLGQAGYQNGFETEIAVSTAFPELEQIAVLLQTNLAKIGVKMKINKMPNAAHQERTSKREFPIFIQWEQANCPDPAYSLYLYYHSESFLDLSDLKDPNLDGLIDQLSSSRDENARAPWAKEAQRILVQDDVPWIWLFHAGTHLAMRDNLSGLTWRTTNSFQFSGIQRV